VTRQPKRVLVAGASGFIGSRLVRRAAAEGDEVRALVREGTDLRRLEAAPEHGLIRGDLSELGEAAREIAAFAPEVCLDAAWGDPRGDTPIRSHERSVKDALGLARLAIDSGCARYLHIGTCFEYAPTDGLLSEDSPTEPHTAYGRAKLAVSEGVRRLAEGSVTSVCSPRVFYVYGPFEHPGRLVPSVIRGLLAGERTPTTAGEQIRDYMHVDDVASAIRAAAECDHEGPLNIASGHAGPVRTVVLTIARLIGREDLLDVGALPYRPEEPPSIRPDTARLRALGWTPSWSLERGLADTIEWWRGPPGAPRSAGAE